MESPVAKVVLEGVPQETDRQDGGMAVILTLYPDDDDDRQTFVRFQSWDDAKQHGDIAPFLGKRLRVTVETVD